MIMPDGISGEATAPQRARGDAMVAARVLDGKTRIADLSMAGSAKLLFPHGSGPVLDTVTLNTAGGLTGGDRFTLRTEARDGAALRLTTQAAERAYRARPGDGPASVRIVHRVGPGASLASLPQETILFDGAALDRCTRYELAGDARLWACETLVFGRAAMGERVSALRLRDRIDLWRDGDLVFTDRLHLDGPADAVLQGPAVMGGGQALATLVLAAPGIEEQIGGLRAALGASEAALSAPSPGLVVGRILAQDSFDLRKVLVPFLLSVMRAPLPRPWML